jgi:hypothetical protein
LTTNVYGINQTQFFHQPTRDGDSSSEMAVVSQSHLVSTSAVGCRQRKIKPLLSLPQSPRRECNSFSVASVDIPPLPADVESESNERSNGNPPCAKVSFRSKAEKRRTQRQSPPDTDMNNRHRLWQFANVDEPEPGKCTLGPPPSKKLSQTTGDYEHLGTDVVANRSIRNEDRQNASYWQARDKRNDRSRATDESCISYDRERRRQVRSEAAAAGAVAAGARPKKALLGDYPGARQGTEEPVRQVSGPPTRDEYQQNRNRVIGTAKMKKGRLSTSTTGKPPEARENVAMPRGTTSETLDRSTGYHQKEDRNLVAIRTVGLWLPGVRRDRVQIPSLLDLTTSPSVHSILGKLPLGVRRGILGERPPTSPPLQHNQISNSQSR